MLSGKGRLAPYVGVYRWRDEFIRILAEALTAVVDQGLDEPVSEASVADRHGAGLTKHGRGARLLKTEEALRSAKVDLFRLTVCEERLDDCLELRTDLGGLGYEVFGAVGPVFP